MGILGDAAAILEIGALGVIGFLVYSNWDNIREGFCKIPGATATGWCGDDTRPPNCECQPGLAELCVFQGGTWKECQDDKVTPKCECDYGITENECAIPGTVFCGTFPPLECINTPAGFKLFASVNAAWTCATKPCEDPSIISYYCADGSCVTNWQDCPGV